MNKRADKDAFPMSFGENDGGETGLTIAEYMFTRYVAAFIIARGNDGQETAADITHNAMLFVDASLKELEARRKQGW